MKILFKNTTKYDRENRDNFTNFHNKKYGKKELFRYTLMLIGALYIIFFNIMHNNWFFLLILTVLLMVIYLLNKQIIQKEKDKNKKQKNKEFTFFFYERYIKIKYMRQFDRINYFELNKIFETQENFFLYTDDKHSLILDKEGFEIGTSKEFSKFIKRKCPFKYRNN